MSVAHSILGTDGFSRIHPVYSFEIEHLDVSVAFLHSQLSYTIYVSLPDGYEYKNMKYARLLKSLYGLKQAAHDWYATQHNHIMKFDSRLRRSSNDPCLYFIVDTVQSLLVMITVHVDDYLVASNCKKWRANFFNHMKSKFNVKSLGSASYILGVEVIWNQARTVMQLSVRRLIEDLVISLGLKDAWGASTPIEIRPDFTPGTMNGDLPDVPYRNVLGKLAWIANVRVDIRFAVNYFQRYSNCYTKEMFKGLIRIVKYLKGTSDLLLTYTKPNKNYSMSEPIPLSIYTDSDWAGDKNSRRSTSGGVLYMFNNAIACFSQLQPVVALSSAEAELIAMCENCKEGIFIKNLASEIIPIMTPIPIFYDNAGSGFMAENPINNKRSKHIDIKYKWLHDYISDKIFSLHHVPSEKNDADVFTKSLPIADFGSKVKRIMKSIAAPFKKCFGKVATYE